MSEYEKVDDGVLDARVDAALDAFARGLAFSARSPLLRTPADVGLRFDEVTFPSADGTPLEGWFVPCPGSEKLIICTHPFGFSRYGFPAHLEPWRSAWGTGLGNDFEIDFVRDYEILHDNGYNVLAFDFRNCGLSAAANGGMASNARFEARDVLGALAYVRSRPELAGMALGLFSRCMGAHATFVAMELDAASFAGVRCLVAPLLLSPMVILEQQLERAGLGGHAAEVDRRFQRITGALLAEGSPARSAPAVTVPTLTYGVHDDPLVRPSDLEGIFEAVGAAEKDMFWIHDTIARWDGYVWFQRHPERVLEWFERYMR